MDGYKLRKSSDMSQSWRPHANTRSTREMINYVLLLAEIQYCTFIEQVMAEVGFNTKGSDFLQIIVQFVKSRIMAKNN